MPESYFCYWSFPRCVLSKQGLKCTVAHHHSAAVQRYITYTVSSFKVFFPGMQCQASRVGWPWHLFAKPAKWVEESNIQYSVFHVSKIALKSSPRNQCTIHCKLSMDACVGIPYREMIQTYKRLVQYSEYILKWAVLLMSYSSTSPMTCL